MCSMTNHYVVLRNINHHSRTRAEHSLFPPMQTSFNASLQKETKRSPNVLNHVKCDVCEILLYCAPCRNGPDYLLSSLLQSIYREALSNTSNTANQRSPTHRISKRNLFTQLCAPMRRGRRKVQLQLLHQSEIDGCRYSFPPVPRS